MFVTAHAINRIGQRAMRQASIIEMLEATPGQSGVVAYIVARLTHKMETRDGSNGDLVIAVAVDGSVETVYFRRSTQDNSPAFFGAERIVDLT